MKQPSRGHQQEYQDSDMDESEEHTLGQKKLQVFKLILGILIIFACSFQVYYTSVNTFNHSRQLIRSLHFYILQHTDFDIYWAGQNLLNYPIHEFFLLEDFSNFLALMQDNFAHFDGMVYGMIDQEALNQTQQTLYIQRKDGVIDSYPWTIGEGISQPFQAGDLYSIKETMLDCQLLNIPILAVDINDHTWNFRFQIEPYSTASNRVHLFAEEQISLLYEHVITTLLGVVLLAFLLYQHQLTVEYQDMPDYMLACMLLITGSLSATAISAGTLNLMDGVTCLLAYLWILKFYTREDDYHISLLIRRSYIFVGRLFASFGPVFIAFGMMAYTCFSRYSGQFQSLWRTYLSLFYISYYNMTYESIIVTARANPLSIIFFVVFVLLFTICVYSAMLVSVFCSYVWSKREKKIKKDILANLNIQCSSCNHKYRYIEGKKHIRHRPLSELSVLAHSPVEAAKFKTRAISRINFLAQKVCELAATMQEDFRRTPGSNSLNNLMREEYWTIKKKVKQVLEEQFHEM